MVYTSAIFIYIKSLYASGRYHRFQEDIIVLKWTSYGFGVTYQSGVSPSVYKTCRASAGRPCVARNFKWGSIITS